MQEREQLTELMEFRPIARRAITCNASRTLIYGLARAVWIRPMLTIFRFIGTLTATGALYSRTNKLGLARISACRSVAIPSMLRAGMNPRQKNLPKCFARLSLGFASLAFSFMAITGASGATAVTSSVRREGANSQFARSEDLRAALNAKAPEKRTLAEYRQVVSSYRRVYLITPHAAAVPDALLAVAELTAEMGDRFGRSYYQTAVDSYEFLIREYPASKFVQDAMLRVAQLQKDQLGDPNAAQKSYQDFPKRCPHSARRREVQEALGELALMKNSQPGAPMQPQVSASAMTSAPVGTSPLSIPIATGSRDDAIPAARTSRSSVSGGERARSGS